MAYSATFKKKLTSLSPSESPLILLEINHSSMGTPLRLVNDLQNVTSGGNVYNACAFRITLPSQPETGATESKLELDNVGKELMSALESSAGLRGATVTIKQILRSAPNTIEFSITFFLENIQCTQTIVSGTLRFTDIFNKSCFPTKYNIINSPGLF